MGKIEPDKTAAKMLRKAKVPHGNLQVGALCYRRKGDGLRVLLVTSRGTGRWVCPKGWPIPGKCAASSAAQEAWEEAGVRGRISQKCLGFYRYRKVLDDKRSKKCLVQMFALEVEARSANFPERRERGVKWMTPKKAARAVQEPDLKRLIRKLEDRMAA